MSTRKAIEAADFPQRFQDLSVLGAGGQSRVYRAFDSVLGCPVAVRKMEVEHAWREFSLRAELRHPCLVAVLDVAEDEALQASGQAVLVEEVANGLPLPNFAACSTERVLVIARQLLAALGYLHDHGIAHRDIKPDNLVIGPDSVPVLVDFGLAAPIDSDAASRSGTLGTVAPEVLDGTFDPRRADLFALGTTLLAATTGQAPHAMWSVDARALRAAIEAVDADLRPLLLGLTQTSKAARFQSAQEALQVLERVSRVPLGSARTWPLVGRTAEISAIVEHFRSVDTATSSRRSVVLVGVIGSGRRALASAAAKRVRATTRRAVLIEAVLSVQDLAKVVGEPRTILTTSDPTVPRHLAAILGDEAVLTIEVSALSEAAVADLTRWLAVPAEVDPASVYRASAGVAEALRADLTGAKDDRVIDPAESWIALRGAAVEGASLSRSVEEMLVDAAMRGCVDLDRDGSYRLRSPSRRLSVLQATPREELRAQHAEAAMDGDPWHRALSGDGSEDVLDLGLAQLEEQADVDEVAVSVEHALRMLGSEALTRDAFTSIARRLIGAGKLDLVLRVFTAAPAEDSSAEVLALRSFLEGERGNIAAAVQHAEAALAAATELRLQALLDLARALQWANSLDRALAVLDRAQQLATDEVEAAEVARLRSLVLFRMGRRGEAQECARSALARLGDQQATVRTGLMQNLALALRHAGKLEAAAKLFDEAGAMALARADVRGAAISWINSGLARQDAGDLEAAREARERAMHVAATAGLAQPRDVARASLAMTLSLLGAWPHAAGELDAVVHSLEEQGLRREPRIARIAALEARLQASPDGCASDELEAALAQALAEGGEAEAALAWRALLQNGREPRVVAKDARRMLRAADRNTRELLLVALHDQKPVGDAGARRALDGLARGALPRPRLFAAIALLRRTQDGDSKRAALARVLSLARRNQSPADRVAALTTCLCLCRGAQRDLLSRRILKDLALLEHLAPAPSSEVTLQPWTAKIADLRSALEDTLAPRTSWGELDGLLRVQRMLLEPGADDAARFDAILEEAMRISGAARGMIVARDQGALSVVASRSDLTASVVAGEAAPLEFSRNVLDEVLETGSPRITVNALEDPAWQWANSVVDFKLASIACVPVKIGERVVGALYLDNPFEKGRFREDIADRLEAFGLQVSIGLEAARRRDEIERLNDDLRGKLARVEAELGRSNIGNDIVAASPRMARVLERVRRLAATELTVHIHGETGTGKELIARKLHEHSARRDGPFVTENCSAISSELLESELFGHVKGAFTGAVRDKPGLLRMAHGGTLFLDEIGDMPLALQARILRVLQEGELRPVGGDVVERVDVRIVTATHRDLREMVAKGEFREDLYYRVVVASVDLPPLRERPEDIRVLAAHFLERFGRAGQSFDASAMQRLEAYGWPGNVRELESAIRSTCVLAKGARITASDLPSSLGGAPQGFGFGASLPVRLEDLEKIALVRALELAGGNRGEAAKLLGISRSSVFVKIRKYSLAASD